MLWESYILMLVAFIITFIMLIIIAFIRETNFKLYIIIYCIITYELVYRQYGIFETMLYFLTFGYKL
jgi:hypothetical protein